MISKPIRECLTIMQLYNVQSILEIGCGHGGIIAQFHAPILIGVDNFEPAVIKAKQDYPRPIFLKYDVTQLRGLFIEKSFDAVIGFDILEHLEYEKMVQVVGDCEDFARTLVIFFSPIGQEALDNQPADEDGNPGMKHVTKVEEKYFTGRGYVSRLYSDYYKNSPARAMLAIKEL